ncbi:hypothetical protein KKB3_00987, partial [Dehalococcoides mccartyi]
MPDSKFCLYIIDLLPENESDFQGEEEINRRAKLIEKELRKLPARMPGIGNMSKTRITA